jgi:hypothetical protein
MCLQTQDIACRRIVTEEALGAARIMPGLDAGGAVGAEDRDVFVKSIREKVGIALVVAPLIS